MPVEEIEFEVARDNPAAVQLSKILRLEQVPQLTMNLGIDEQRQITFLVSLTRRLHAQALEEGDQVTVEAVLDEVIKWEKEYFPEKDLAPLRPIVLQRLADGSFGTTDTITESLWLVLSCRRRQGSARTFSIWLIRHHRHNH